MIEAAIAQAGSRVEVSWRNESVFFEVSGIDLPPLQDHSFILWHLAARAMQTGEDILVRGRVDPIVLANVLRACRTWAMWRPGRLHRVNISADEIGPPPAAGQAGLATFFSGGVDSTQMMLSLGRLEHPGTAVTVHGMDYDLDRPDQFDDLLAGTQELLDRLNYGRVIIRSDARKLAKGHHAYSMALAGHAWLLSGVFAGAEIAADHTAEQDFLTFPSPYNSVIHRYFTGSSFQVFTRSEDVSRSQKVASIAGDPMALHSVTFCKEKSLRPKNCGRCKKCLRTKAMFMVSTGAIPDIFVDHSFGAKEWNSIDLSDRIERAYLIDVYEAARDRKLHIPELEAVYRKAFKRSGIKYFLGNLTRGAWKQLRRAG